MINIYSVTEYINFVWALISRRFVTISIYFDRLVLRWVTVRRYTVLVFNQDTQANSAWSSLRG